MNTRRMIHVALLAALLVVTPLAAQQPTTPPQAPGAEMIVGPPQGQPLSGEALEKRTKEVGSLVRCPVCQGLSVYDSPAQMAVNMKEQVRELLAKGYTEEQILTYFEKSYGEFVLLQPKMTGANWIVWLAPLALLIVGGFVIRGFLKKRSNGDEPAAASETPGEERGRLPADPRLAEYVLKARELAYGWPGGVEPKQG